MGKGYYTLTRITDYGPYVTKLILPLPEGTKARGISAATFSVFVERTDDRGEILLLPKSWMARDDKEPSRGFVPVKAAYLADKYGEPQKDGTCLALDMEYGPTMALSAAICAPNGFNVYIRNHYRVTQVKPLQSKSGAISGLVYDYPLGNYSPDAHGWVNSTSSYKEEPLNYGYFVPQTPASGPRPLIIWLHGAGEGGEDPTIAYTGNKVVALSSEKVQKLFGGAYVLAPQTRTFWMNDGSGQYGKTGKSKYVKALKACIDEFIEKNPAIDRDRVYIGGDSNGGFMTMRMILDYPGFFAAAFPVCEALYDDTITDKQLKGIAKLPIWFTHAKNDPVVKPEETVVPTYKRLVKAGNKNVHFTFWDNVVDMHEGFKDKDGKPFEYIGHFTWIPMLNDDCKVDFNGKPVTFGGKKVTLLQWLAQQKR